MRGKRFILILLFILNIGIGVKADETCEKEVLNNVKELASKVEVNYEYQMKEVKQNDSIIKYPLFSLTAVNLNKRLKVVIESNDKEFKDGDNISATISGFHEGEKITVIVKAFTPDKCSGRVLRSITVKLPYYNSLSEEDVCYDYPDFKYCSAFSEQRVSLEKFNVELEKYIENPVSNVDDAKDKDDDNTINIWIIVGASVSVLIIVFIITRIIKIRRKNSL